MLYFSSPYYRVDRFSGANKRFEEIISECEKLSEQYRVIVVKNHTPKGICKEKCIYIPSRVSRSRLMTWIWLNLLFLFLQKGVVINDFKPVPVLSYFRHDTFLLIHDLRKILNNSGHINGITGRLQVLMLRIFPSIITVSHYSKELLVKHCGLSDHRVIVSYNGVASTYTSEFIERGRDIDILYVAHFEERKRHIDLLEAVTLYKKHLNIVFVGVDNGEYKRLEPVISKVRDLGHDVKIMSGVSENDLIGMYRRTKVYAFPSALEGFGMPLIEAKSQGCKILCSDLIVFKEICSNDDYIFKVKNIDSLFSELSKALFDNKKSIKIDVEDKFIWRKITNRLLYDVKR